MVTILESEVEKQAQFIPADIDKIHMALQLALEAGTNVILTNEQTLRLLSWGVQQNRECEAIKAHYEGIVAEQIRSSIALTLENHEIFQKYDYLTRVTVDERDHLRLRILELTEMVIEFQKALVEICKITVTHPGNSMYGFETAQFLAYTALERNVKERQVLSEAC